MRSEPANSPPRGALDIDAFAPLSRDPHGEIDGKLNGVPYRARVIVPDYRTRILRRYRGIAPRGLDDIRARLGIPIAFAQFGLRVRFDHAVELALHDQEMVLDPSVRALVATYGPVVFHNAVIAGPARKHFHRNIFPHLKFHTDRGPTMPNRYSCFTRDPAEAEQRPPRRSSTVFVATIVAWLEGVRDGQIDPAVERGARMSIDLFAGGGAAALLGDIVLEQPWDEADGTGEIAVIDNATVLHATYNKIDPIKGYPIGARYLS